MNFQFSKKVTTEEKRNAIYRHLYKMNINQLIKEGKVISDPWKVICYETAQADLNHIMLAGGLTDYYNRLQRGAV